MGEAPAAVASERRRYLEIAEEYAADVRDGIEPASLLTRLAVDRWYRDLERAARGDEDFPWRIDEDRVDLALGFVELMPHIKGRWARSSGRLVLARWQVFAYVNVFGWVDPADGLRRFTVCYIEVPRKNGKSTVAAPVALYMLAADGEPGAEVYSAATSRDQARIVFDVARNMARREEGFRREYGVHVGAHNLSVLSTASKLESLSSDAHTLDGLNPHCAVIDELHAHKTRDVWDVLETAVGARDQPLLFAITTAGSNRAGICYEVRSYLRKILEGTVQDDRVWGIIYTIDEGDDWNDPAVWRKANPNFGVSVYEEDLARLARKAAEMPAALNTFLTKRLNVWVSAASAWIDIRRWDACAEPDLTLAEYEGRRAFVGIDLASKIDLAAMMILFPPIDEDEPWAVFGRYYLPEARLEETLNSQFSGWEREGRLVATPGETTDYEWIEDDLREWAKRFDLAEVAYDPFQATQFSTRMAKEGIPMVEVPATVRSYSEPMKEFGRLIYDCAIIHDGDPVLSWMMSNVTVRVDAKENIYPRKERESDKIDGVVGIVSALNRALVDPGASRSVYENRGLLRL